MDYTLETFHLALMAWQEGKPEHALAIKDREAHIDEQEEDLRRRHIDRLNQNLCSPISGVVYLDIISNLERIGAHAANFGEYYLGTRMN